MRDTIAKRALWFIWLVVGAGAAPTQAASYLNRPGGTLSALNTELATCRSVALERHTAVNAAPGAIGVGNSPAAAAQNAAMASLMTGLINGLVAAADQNRTIESCLLMKGWRKVELDQSEKRRLRDAVVQDPSLNEAIIGADPVIYGKITTVWDAEYAIPAPIHDVSFCDIAQKPERFLVMMIRFRASYETLNGGAADIFDERCGHVTKIAVLRPTSADVVTKFAAFSKISSSNPLKQGAVFLGRLIPNPEKGDAIVFDVADIADVNPQDRRSISAELAPK